MLLPLAKVKNVCEFVCERKRGRERERERGGRTELSGVNIRNLFSISPIDTLLMIDWLSQK